MSVKKILQLTSFKAVISYMVSHPGSEVESAEGVRFRYDAKYGLEILQEHPDPDDDGEYSMHWYHTDLDNWRLKEKASFPFKICNDSPFSEEISLEQAVNLRRVKISWPFLNWRCKEYIVNLNRNNPLEFNQALAIIFSCVAAGGTVYRLPLIRAKGVKCWALPQLFFSASCANEEVTE